jgi:ABC-2 type transport system permease protein
MTFGQAATASLYRELAYLRHNGWDLSLLLVLPAVSVILIAAVFFVGVFHNVPIAVVDADHSPLSRAIYRNLLATPKVRITQQLDDLSAAWPLVRSGNLYAVVYIPAGLEARALRREDGAVIVYFNAAFQGVASQAADASRRAIESALSGATNIPGLAVPSSTPLFSMPKIQTTIVGNPEQSFELFLQILITPLVLNLLLSCAVVFSVGRELSDATLPDWHANSGGRVLAALIGKLIPYILIYWLFFAGWIAYLAGVRGWHVAGSLSGLFFATLLFFCATGSIAAFLVSTLRKLDLSLSISALYAGSALSFANATLTVNGASLFTQAWSALLPSTSYVRIELQQWILGSPLASATYPLLILLGFIGAPLTVAVHRLSREAVLGSPKQSLPPPRSPSGFVASFVETLRAVATTQPILSTVVFSVVLYGFYYPAAYKVQTVLKLPVAVADLDHSPLSRSLLRHLDATREMNIIVQTASAADAQSLLAKDKVDGVVVLDQGLEASILKGTPGGVAAYLKGAYLVRSRFLGQALAGAVQGSIGEVLAPLLSPARAETDSIATIERPLYNTTGGYGDYTVPGVASVILQATLLFGVAMFMGLIRENAAWHIKPAAFFGLWAAFTVLGTLTSLFFFGFVLWFQDYPRGGNLPGLFLCTPVFCASVSALGLLIGSFFERHERSMQILAGTSIPIFFLSGLSWPAFAMPHLVAIFAALVPSTTAVPLFVKLNSMGASLREIRADLALLICLSACFGATAYLRLVRSRVS